MPRRVTKSKPSLLAPAGSFIKRLSDDKARVRRHVFMFAFWCLTIFFSYSLVSGDYGVPRIIKLNLEKTGYEEANRRQLVRLLDATRERNMLLNDSTYIEFIARTQYHMARPNETIYRYRSR